VFQVKTLPTLIEMSKRRKKGARIAPFSKCGNVEISYIKFFKEKVGQKVGPKTT
jgi:hypothetical protein